MEFGAGVCSARAPRCPACPVRRGCPSRSDPRRVPVPRQSILDRRRPRSAGALLKALTAQGHRFSEQQARRPWASPTPGLDYEVLIAGLARDGLVHRSGGLLLSGRGGLGNGNALRLFGCDPLMPTVFSGTPASGPGAAGGGPPLALAECAGKQSLVFCLVPTVLSQAAWPASVGSIRVPRRSLIGQPSDETGRFGIVQAIGDGPARQVQVLGQLTGRASIWLPRGAQLAEQVKRLVVEVELGEGRSIEVLNFLARIWIRSTMPSVSGSRFGISRAQTTSMSSRWSRSLRAVFMATVIVSIHPCQAFCRRIA